MTDWQVIHGDSRAVLAGMGDASVDCILTDPPYGHNNNNGDLMRRLLATLSEGRKFIGIEIDAGYCEIARKRIEAAANKAVAV